LPCSQAKAVKQGLFFGFWVGGFVAFYKHFVNAIGRGGNTCHERLRARVQADPAALWRHAYAEFGRLLRRDFWTPTMSAKEPDTLVMGHPRKGRFPAHRAHQHPTAGDEVIGSSRERVTAGCAQCDRPGAAAFTALATPPGAAPFDVPVRP